MGNERDDQSVLHEGEALWWGQLLEFIARQKQRGLRQCSDHASQICAVAHHNSNGAAAFIQGFTHELTCRAGNNRL